MATSTKVSVATRTKLITKSTFNNYDLCLNSYVGCEFGCTYCYVRFFVKDDEKEWGEFVRIRDHMADRLPIELNKGAVKILDGRIPILDSNGNPELDDKGQPKTKPKHKILPISQARLVLGTMTDPYQPVERKHRITRTALQIITSRPNQFKKVGIFTRSPIVLDDLDLILKLPQARVHFTITPFQPNILRTIEPYSPVTNRRWEVVKTLKQAGLRVHVNVSPVMPIISDPFVEEFARTLAEIGVDEYFVDPMQPYKDSFDAFEKACQTVPNLEWQKIKEIMLDKERYLDWKTDFFWAWNEVRKKHQHLAPSQLPIWSDHENSTWVDMRTGNQMSRRDY